MLNMHLDMQKRKWSPGLLKHVVLGITNNDDASACIIVDGEIVAAAQEERFSRIKLDNNWPHRAISYVMQEANVTLRDINALAYGWSTGFNADCLLLDYLDRSRKAASSEESWSVFRKRVADEIANDVNKRQEFLDFSHLSGFDGSTFFVDHHEAHGMGAYLCSPYDEAVVVTCDGRGDYLSFTISHCEQGRRKLLHKELTHDSLGYFYGRITKLLGFVPNRHEGKVTGLAAHGDPSVCKDLMKSMIRVEDGRIRGNLGQWYSPSYNGYSEALLHEISKYSREDVAAAAQSHIEEIICEMVSQYVPAMGKTPICLAGGVFGNVRLNQKIRELPGVNSVFVLPSMGDGGLSLAAAVTVAHNTFGVRPQFRSVALGPSYNNAIIPDSSFASFNFKLTDIPGADAIVDALAEDQVVGLVRGRMEFGPRALCNRSLIYHTRDKSSNDWLNKRLHRTEFMPFAPVTAENLADQCYIGWDNTHLCAHYMTMTYDCTDLMKDRCPAVVHVDGTARPQVVTKAADPFMYELLNLWFEKVGEPALINTSFNRHEEPIINSPEEAYDTLSKGVVDSLFIADRYKIERLDRNEETPEREKSLAF